MIASLFRSVLVSMLVGTLAIGAPVYGQSQEQSQEQSQGQAQSPQAQTPDQSQAQPQAEPTPRPNFTLSTAPDYSKGKRFFPQVFAPYTPIQIAKPVLTNSPRIDQLLREGKLYLSLNDAISLALENNLDIAVQRYVPWIADTDLLRTKGGGVARGLGGTGTATALGAIPQASFDPSVTSSLFWSRNDLPVNNPLTSGVGTSTSTLGSVINYNAQMNFNYQQAFHTGTSLGVAWDNTRSSTSSTFPLFNPSVATLATISVQQQLLNGFGLLPNTRFILEAKNNRKVADLTLATQVIASVSAVENAYFELVFARQNVTVEEAAVKTSQKLFEDNKRQVEIGTLAPIEVVRAESQLATDQQNLIVAQTVQLQDQTVLLNLITRDPLATPQLLNVEVVPTDTIVSPPPTDVIPLQDAVKEAWQKRPEIRSQELNLKTAGIEVRATRNALLPVATLFGQWGGNGLGGTSRSTTITPTAFAANLNSPVVDSTGTPVPNQFASTVTAATLTSTTTPGGFGDAFDRLVNGKFPTYAYGLNLSIPIRNRSAQADSARALLDERQAETQYRQLQNSVILDVRNAQILLQQGRARVEAAEKARVLAQQTLDAEQKKYQLGASTVFLVIQAQRDLTTAQGNEIRAKADLAEAKVAFDKAMGRTLEVNNITVAGARAGHVDRAPLIPGTPTAEILGGAK